MTFADPLNLGIVFKASAIETVADLLLAQQGLQRVEASVSPDAGPRSADHEIVEAEST